jgi:hypothetical protein
VIDRFTNKKLELTLAAEFGRELINKNEELNRRCQELEKQLRQRRTNNGPRRPGTPLRNGTHINLDASPSVDATISDDHLRPIALTQSASQSNGFMSSPPVSRPFDPEAAAAEERFSGSDDDYTGSRGPIRPTPHRSYISRTQSMGRQPMPDQEAIEALELKNAELEMRLAQVQAEAEKARKASARRAKQAEKDLALTRRELDNAYERIKELDEELTAQKAAMLQQQNGGPCHSRRMRRNRTVGHTAYGEKHESSDSDENEDLDQLDVKGLRRRILELESARDALNVTKRIVSERLAHAQQEVKQLRQENSELRTRVRSYNQLQEEFEQQAAHLEQLERALEEQRRYARGEFSPMLAPVPHARSPDLTAEGLRRRGKNLMDEFERGRSLMDEFEMVLFRGTDGDSDSYGPSGVDTLFNALAGAAQAGRNGEPLGSDAFMLSDLVTAVGQATFGDQNGVVSKPQDTGFFGLLRGFLHAIWRWFRFLCVLWCAVVVSVYRGPPKVITSA